MHLGAEFEADGHDTARTSQRARKILNYLLQPDFRKGTSAASICGLGWFQTTAMAELPMCPL